MGIERERIGVRLENDFRFTALIYMIALAWTVAVFPLMIGLFVKSVELIPIVFLPLGVFVVINSSRVAFKLLIRPRRVRLRNHEVFNNIPTMTQW